VNYIAGIGRGYRKALTAVESGNAYDVEEAIRELNAISHRSYTPGFLTGDLASKSMDFDKRDEFRSEEFTGIVRGYNEETKMAHIEVKGRLDIGQEYRVINPDSEFFYTLEKIDHPKNGVVESAHPGGLDVWINMPTNPGEF
jgi:putative protease